MWQSLSAGSVMRRSEGDRLIHQRTASMCCAQMSDFAVVYDRGLARSQPDGDLPHLIRIERALSAEEFKSVESGLNRGATGHFLILVRATRSARPIYRSIRKDRVGL